MTKDVKEYLDALRPWIEPWALMTQAEREVQRRGSSAEEMRAFYDAMLPRMEGIIETLNAFPLNDLPPDARTLMNLTLSLAEVAPHVEFYKGSPKVPFSFEEERFIAERASLTTL